MKLAERGSWIGDRRQGLWVREIRKLTSSGHQTSLISSAYRQLALEDAAGLFSRWSQENFFRYMMEHFAIDLLSEYGTEAIPGTNRPVVNPNWRELDRQSRTLKGKLVQRQARFAALTLPDTTQGVLEVRVHSMTNPRSNRAIAHLLKHLNDASFTYPGTTLKLVYTMPGLLTG